MRGECDDGRLITGQRRALRTARPPEGFIRPRTLKSRMKLRAVDGVTEGVNRFITV